jgi:hypothetical protein
MMRDHARPPELIVWHLVALCAERSWQRDVGHNRSVSHFRGMMLFAAFTALPSGHTNLLFFKLVSNPV